MRNKLFLLHFLIGIRATVDVVHLSEVSQGVDSELQAGNGDFEKLFWYELRGLEIFGQ